MSLVARYAVLAVVGLVLCFFNPLTQLAAGYNKEIAVGGTAIYASLRGLSSVMSIVRDADVQASIGVASIATSPGQALQPVIATIERMANLLFALVLASGVLGFTLPIVAGLGALVLVIGAGVRTLALAIGRPLAGASDRLARAAVALGTVAAICIPMAYGLAFVIGDRFTADAWNRAAELFDKQAETLSIEDVVGPTAAVEPVPPPDSAAEAPPSDGGNILDWAKGAIDGAVEGSSRAVEGALAATTGFATAVSDQVTASARVVTDGLSMAADLFQASVDIGVAYVVKLAVLPLLILAGIVWLFRSLGQGGTAGPDGSQVRPSAVQIDSGTTRPAPPSA